MEKYCEDHIPDNFLIQDYMFITGFLQAEWKIPKPSCVPKSEIRLFLSTDVLHGEPGRAVSGAMHGQSHLSEDKRSMHVDDSSWLKSMCP
jgi:hypothetical protein